MLHCKALLFAMNIIMSLCYSPVGLCLA